MIRTLAGRKLAVVAVLIALATACTKTTVADELETSGGSPETAVDQESTATTPSSSDDVADDEPTASNDDGVFDVDDPNTTVTIVDPGAEPRRELRFSYQEGSQQNIGFAMNMSSSTSMGGVPMNGATMSLPTINMPLSCEVTKTDSRGSAEVQYTYGDVSMAEDGSLDPAMRSQMESTYDSLSGTSVDVTQTTRGQVIYVDASQMEALTGTTGMSVNQMGGQAVPLPAEPLGVGAVWTATQTVKPGGIGLQQTATYTLVASDGDHLTIQTQISQQIDPSASPVGGVGFTKLTSTGTGTNEVDLSLPCPVGFNMTMHQELEASDPGTSQSIQQISDIVMTFTGGG